MNPILPFLTRTHLRVLFIIGASLLVVGMPFSVVFMSIGTIWISSVYILEGGFKEKIAALKTPVLYMILGLFFLHIIGLAWSTNVKQGLREIEKFLPFLAIPVVFSGIQCIKEKDKRLLIWLFVLITLVSCTLILISALLEGTEHNFNPRVFSKYVSHIRLSLYACLSIVFLIGVKINRALRILGIAILLSYIIFMQSLTGIVLLAALSTAYFMKLFSSECTGFKLLRWIFGLLIITAFSFLAYTVTDYYRVKTPGITPEKTADGHNYEVGLDNGFIENGSRLWSHVCYEELNETFTVRTGFSIWEPHPKGYSYNSLLLRYLNNKGLTKDQKGVEALTEEDLERIIDGNPYPNHWKYKGFSKRIRAILFQFEKNKIQKDFTGNSLTEKVVFQSVAWHTYLQSPLLGTGTGDLKDDMKVFYKNAYPELNEKKMRKPHNQFLTFLVMLGPAALILFIFILVALWRLATNRTDLTNTSRAFIIILAISCFSEDTTGTQAGITFTSFFIGLLFLFKPKLDE